MKFERVVKLKLGTMETKTENNIMTEYFDEIIEHCGNITTLFKQYCHLDNSWGIENEGFVGRVGDPLNILPWIFENWTKQLTNIYSYKKNLTMDEDELIITRNQRTYFYFIDKSDCPTLKRQYVSYTFINFDSIKKIDVFFPSKIITQGQNGAIVIKDYPINIKNYILSSYDFTDDLKIQMSKLSIEEQIQMIQDMNDQKHRKIGRQEYRIREQEAQMTLMQTHLMQMPLMQSIISSMQNQIQEQSKLIASLQSRLVLKKEQEKVEVDMFADWLKDDEEDESVKEDEEPEEDESVKEEEDEETEEEAEIVYTRNTGPVRIVDYNKGSSFEVIGDTEKHYHSLIKLRCKWSMLKNQETGEKYYGWLFDYPKKRLIEKWIEEGCLNQAEAEEKRLENWKRDRAEEERKRAEEIKERTESEIKEMKRTQSIRDLERRIEENRKERIQRLWIG